MKKMKKRQLVVLTYFVIIEAYVCCIPLTTNSPAHKAASNPLAAWFTDDRLSLAGGIAVLFFFILIGATYSEKWWPSAPKAPSKPRKK